MDLLARRRVSSGHCTVAAQDVLRTRPLLDGDVLTTPAQGVLRSRHRGACELPGKRRSLPTRKVVSCCCSKLSCLSSSFELGRIANKIRGACSILDIIRRWGESSGR